MPSSSTSIDLNNIIKVNFRPFPFKIKKRKKSVKDYTGDRFAAMELIRKLTKAYHDRGHTGVKFWLEPEIMPSGRKLYGIRSNIVFRCP